MSYNDIVIVAYWQNVLSALWLVYLTSGEVKRFSIRLLGAESTILNFEKQQSTRDKYVTGSLGDLIRVIWESDCTYWSWLSLNQYGQSSSHIIGIMTP